MMKSAPARISAPFLLIALFWVEPAAADEMIGESPAADQAAAADPSAHENRALLFHLRCSIGPSSLIAHGKGHASLDGPTREARGWYTWTYGGGGVSLEIAPGFSLGQKTVELFTVELDWYVGEHFAGDTRQLELMNAERQPGLRAVVVGFGVGWPIRPGSIWRLGAAGGIGLLMPQLESPYGTIDGEVGGNATGSFSIGPRWSLASTGPHPQSALTIGARTRLGVGVGLESAFASAAVLADVAFQ